MTGISAEYVVLIIGVMAAGITIPKKSF